MRCFFFQINNYFATMKSAIWLFFAIILATFTEPLVADQSDGGQKPPANAPAPPLPDPPPAEPDFEDAEWHMDYVPAGYLPDSVYRELAWYGILQLQPLHHSSKHLEVAQLIWMHTLGRPHVIMENPPQSAQTPPKVNRQVIAEEGSKWSREQRSHQELVMENIKNGVGGVTVRTVISLHKTSNYIIKEAIAYECDDNSQPDLDSYVKGSHNDDPPMCMTNDGMSEAEATPLEYDPCMEGETAPLEYSSADGWVFCFGTKPRKANYDDKGRIDCGEKTKVKLQQFLDECAVDNNVVLTLDYFANDPRKEVMHNSTLCDTWDPCHLSYLYRIEPPQDMPHEAASTDAGPCDTTVCEECIVTDPPPAIN